MIPLSELKNNTFYSFNKVPYYIKHNLFQIFDYCAYTSEVGCYISIYNKNLQKLQRNSYVSLNIVTRKGIKYVDNIVPGVRPEGFRPVKLKDFLRN